MKGLYRLSLAATYHKVHKAPCSLFQLTLQLTFAKFGNAALILKSRPVPACLYRSFVNNLYYYFNLKQDLKLTDSKYIFIYDNISWTNKIKLPKFKFNIIEIQTFLML